MATKNCQCGAGLPRRALRDARTNLVCYACDRCEPYKRAFLGPVVVDQSASGGEARSPNNWHDSLGEGRLVTGHDYCVGFLADKPSNYSEFM